VSYQLKLKVVWLPNLLGLGIDQITFNQRHPLTAYYFWPRTEAWDQLRSELESKPWLNKKDKIELLNVAADVMNYWRQYRNTEQVENVKNQFFEADFIDLQN
jgi:30S ribosomal protein 3